MKTSIAGNWRLAKITTILLLCFIASFVSAEELKDFNKSDNNYKYTKKRIIDANFNTSDAYSLSLYGKFSDYEISTWNENQVGFHVEIVTKSNKEEKAEDLLRQIDIEFNHSKTDKKIVAKTVLPNKMNNVEFQIDYYIMIPKNISLLIDNSYGDINIDRLDKYLDLDLDYGSFSIDSLLADNKIDVCYGNAKIKYAEKVDAKISYGNVRVNTGDDVNVNLRYGNGKFGEIKNLKAFCQYSDVSCSDIDSASLKVQYTDTYLKNVNDVTIDGSYSDVEIDYLLKKINFFSTYGDIEINKVSQDFEVIDIKTVYSDVNVVFLESHRFSYNISVSYGDIDGDLLKDNARRYIKENNEITVIGNFNDDNEEHQIKVDMKYGDFELEF